MKSPCLTNQRRIGQGIYEIVGLGASAALLEHRLEEINGVLAAELYERCRAVALGDPYAYSALSPMVMAVSWITELTGNGDR